MAAKIPERFLWALGLLDIQPVDRLLEIGCGHGILLSLVADKLDNGSITAIDRSGKMVAAASKRNAAHLAAGKAAILREELAAADFGGQRFDKIFAFRVNIFWVNPAPALAAVKRLLEPGGTLHLFFDPPAASQAEPIAAKLAGNLAANGFRVRETVIAEIGSAKGVCVVGQVQRQLAWSCAESR